MIGYKVQCPYKDSSLNLGVWVLFVCVSVCVWVGVYETLLLLIMQILLTPDPYTAISSLDKFNQIC